MEACGASHYWARVLRGLGHEVVLMPPQYVKPYAQRNKNDKIDAEAICEAMSRPMVQARFVPIKTVEQQAALTMLGARDLLVKQRTMLVNAIRGHAAEFGVTVAKGPQQVSELLRRLATDEGVPSLAREMIGVLAGQLPVLEARLKAIEARLVAWHRHNARSPGSARSAGQLCPQEPALAKAGVPQPRVFRSSRHFAAWIGITPREHSTAGRQRLGQISKESDEDLRRLLVLGATAVIQQAKPGRASPRIKSVG